MRGSIRVLSYRGIKEGPTKVVISNGEGSSNNVIGMGMKQGSEICGLLSDILSFSRGQQPTFDGQ